MRRILVSLIVAAIIAGVVSGWHYLSREARPALQETPVAQAPSSVTPSVKPGIEPEPVSEAAPAVSNPAQESANAPQPGSISGKFLDKDTGEGVPGVHIEAYRWKPRQRPNNNPFGLTRAAETASIVNGRFEMTGLMPGPYLLVWSGAPGYIWQQAEDCIRVEVYAGERVHGLVLDLTRGVPISGRVVDMQSTPIAGAEVHVMQHNDKPLVAFANVQGEFAFNNAQAGMGFLIEAAAPGFAASRLTRDADGGTQTVGSGGVSGIEIVLAPGRSFEGVLVDEAGQPIPNVALSVEEPTWISDVRTKQDGTFLLMGFLEGMTETKLRGETDSQYIEFLHGTGTVPLGPEPHKRGVRLVGILRLPSQFYKRYEKTNLNPSSSMTAGRVVDAYGSPVNNVTIAARNLLDPDSSDVVESGPDGRFAIDIGMVGEADVRVRVDGVVSDEFNGIPAGSKDNVLTIRRSLPVTGVVRDVTTGDSVKRFRVVVTSPSSGFSPVWPTSPNGDIDSSEVIYTPDGRFTVYTDSADSVRVFVTAPGYAPAQQDLTLGQGGLVQPAQFSLQPERMVTGVVVDSAGTPIDVASVGVQTSEPSGRAVVARTVTRDDGRFVLGGLRAAVCQIFAEGDGFAGTTTEVDLTLVARADLRIVLERTGGIEGHVLRDGEPVTVFVNARLLETVTGSAEEYGRVDWDATTGSEGRYKLLDMPAGKYQVVCNVSGLGQPEMREVEVESGKVTQVNFP